MKPKIFFELITVSNRRADYEGAFTHEEISIIETYLTHPCLHLFSGNSQLGEIRIDLANSHATQNLDVFTYLSQNSEVLKHKIRTILLDPPYSSQYAQIYGKKHPDTKAKQFIMWVYAQQTTDLFNAIKIIHPDRIILKSWQYYIPDGYVCEKGYICYAGGYRKPVFLLIMHRNNNADPLSQY